MDRMGDEKLATRSDARKVEGKRKRGRLRVRWENCGEWRTPANDWSWRLLIENV